MAQCAASYGEAVLHAPSGALHKNAFSDEAASFHYAMKHYFVSLNNMKHSLRSYDVKYEKWEFFCLQISLFYAILFDSNEEVFYEKQTIKILQWQNKSNKTNNPNTVFLMLGIGTLRMSLCEALELYAGKCTTAITLYA